MVRNIISVCFYSLGGFWVYLVCLLAFTRLPDVGAFKFIMMGGFSVPAFICLILGAALGHFQHWKASTGIALLAGAGFNVLVVMTFICIQFTPEFGNMFPGNPLAAFNDYYSGFSVTAVLAGAGGFLLIRSNRKSGQPAVPP